MILPLYGVVLLCKFLEETLMPIVPVPPIGILPPLVVGSISNQLRLLSTSAVAYQCRGSLVFLLVSVTNCSGGSSFPEILLKISFVATDKPRSALVVTEAGRL